MVASPASRGSGSRAALGRLAPICSVADDLAAVRARTLSLVAPLSTADLERQIDPLMSPLVWDLAHIAAYEDLWLVHRLGGRELLHGELAAVYDAFETPRSVRGEIELLDHDGALALPRRGQRTRRSRSSTSAAPTRCSTSSSCATSCSTPRRCCRRCASAASTVPGARRAAADDAAGPAGSTCPAARCCMGAEQRRLRLRQRAPAPRAAGRAVPHLAAAGVGRRAHRRRRRGHAGGATSPGTRPTRSPARAARDCPPRPSGSTPPGSACSATPASSGSGPPPSSPATRASSRTPTASTPRSSSTRATASCAAARGRRIRASPAPRSATGTSPSGGRSSRA